MLALTTSTNGIENMGGISIGRVGSAVAGIIDKAIIPANGFYPGDSTPSIILR